MKKKKSRKSPSKKKAAAKKGVGVVPLGDKILIRPLSAEEAGTTTSFGIIIPDSAKEKPEQGVVIAVGAGRRTDMGERIPAEVKAGDRVYFKKPWDEPMKIAGVEYYVIAESDITLIQK